MVALFTAKLLSTFGSWLTMLALPWFVLVTTGSPVRMSLVLTAEFLGVVILGLPSGKVVARLGLRRTMLICDAARVPLMALIPVLHLAGGLSLPVLLAVSFGLGAFTTPYVSSQRLIVPELLGPERGADEKLVARANGLIDGATRGAAFAGPAIGGVLIALLGPVHVLWIDAATYLISCLILLIFVHPAEEKNRPQSKRPGRSEGEGGVRRAEGVRPGEADRVTGGIRYLLQHRTLRLFTAALVLIGGSIPVVYLALPVLVLRELGGDPRTLGLLTAAVGAGLAAGSLVTVLARLPRWALVVAAGLQCTPLWLLLTDRKAVLIAGLFLTGAATPALAATFITRFTLLTPADRRPQVMAAVTTIENLAGFVGYTAAGPALQLGGPRPVFAAVAALATAGAGVYVRAVMTDKGQVSALAPDISR